VDPGNLHNRQIVDIDKAPRNAQGEVEFSADVYLYKPKDMAKGNGAVLFEVSNRGGRGILRLVDGGSSADPNGEIGDGFLLRQGYTVAWLGCSLTWRRKERRFDFLLPLPMMREEKRFAGWYDRTSSYPKRQTVCRWGISC